MKYILFLLQILFTLSFTACENLSDPDVYEKAYLNATINNTSDTIKINTPLIISLTIPTELHTSSNKTYTLTGSNIKKQSGFLISSKENGDSSAGYFNSYNGFFENGEWKLKVYFNAVATYPYTYSLNFTPKDTGLYYLSFNYPIDILLKDANKQVQISTYVDFDVPNKHHEMITNKYTSWQSYIDKLNNDKIGFHVFYAKP